MTHYLLELVIVGFPAVAPRAFQRLVFDGAYSLGALLYDGPSHASGVVLVMQESGHCLCHGVRAVLVRTYVFGHYLASLDAVLGILILESDMLGR
jgi:hypothetical protein